MMAKQGELFRDRAVARLEVAHADWIAKMLALVRAFSPGTALSTDKLWSAAEAWGLGVPREPRAMGAVITAARREGLLRPTGRYVKSERPECHARPVAVWERR